MHGIEWIVEAQGCRPGTLRDITVLRSLFAAIVRDLDLHPVGETRWHKFPGSGGITGLCLALGVAPCDSYLSGTSIALPESLLLPSASRRGISNASCRARLERGRSECTGSRAALCTAARTLGLPMAAALRRIDDARRGRCPNCGAPLDFKWPSSVQTVCAYCKSIIIRTDVDLQKVGTVADLPPDSSPIQIATEGIYKNKAFTVAGRIIYEYEQGTWNEWHVVQNDGASAWLSDAQSQYCYTSQRRTKIFRPHAQVQVGNRYHLGRVFPSR